MYMDEIFNAMDTMFEDLEIDDHSSDHGKVVDYRFEAFFDVLVYEDGYEERFYIGD